MIGLKAAVLLLKKSTATTIRALSAIRLTERSCGREGREKRRQRIVRGKAENRGYTLNELTLYSSHNNQLLPV